VNSPEPKSSQDDSTKALITGNEVDAELVGSDEASESSTGQDTVIEFQSTSEFSGPLPPPASFAHYENILPGSAERIFRMTEKQLDHSIDLEKAEASANRRLLDAQIATATWAQWFTFVLVLVFLALAAYALYKGQTLTTAGAGLAALATIAYALRGQKAPPDEYQSSSSDVDTADASTDNDR